MIKCPHCDSTIEMKDQEEIEASLWNFDGEKADIEMYLYCAKCGGLCLATVRYDMRATNVQSIFKR